MTESTVQRAILEYLTLKRVWAVRLNSGGAMVQGHGGKGQFIRFGAPGMPDILARGKRGSVVWIEVKSATGRQSDNQREWQRRAEAHGDTYILARSLDDVMPLFEQLPGGSL